MQSRIRILGSLAAILVACSYAMVMGEQVAPDHSPTLTGIIFSVDLAASKFVLTQEMRPPPRDGDPPPPMPNPVIVAVTDKTAIFTRATQPVTPPGGPPNAKLRLADVAKLVANGSTLEAVVTGTTTEQNAHMPTVTANIIIIFERKEPKVQ